MGCILLSDLRNSYFVVTCHGWSASNWLANALHKHPNILCAHSSAALPADDPSVFDGDGLKKKIPALRKGYIARQNRSLTDLYESLPNPKNAHIIGSVHTYRLRDLPAQTELITPRSSPIPVVNLVRHPLDLVVSGYGQFKDLFRIDLNEFSWTLNKIVARGLEMPEAICAKHNVDPGDYDSVCFLGACVVLGSLRLDLDALDAVENSGAAHWDFRGHVQMEQLTRDPNSFSRLLPTLTNRNDLATTEYLDSVFTERKVNIHNHDAPSGTHQRWNALKPWQQEAFRAYLDLFELQKQYEAIGYDFSMMEG